MFLYGFAKSERDNIADDELEDLRELGTSWLTGDLELMAAAVEDGRLREVECGNR